ncbi:hypothetical protein, partial [Salmonella sp. s55044]|uniref:hypothetical protein n=1 Tax=Salmonella sp. s55044 TaxID=3159677 RepID=UPI003980F327
MTGLLDTAMLTPIFGLSDELICHGIHDIITKLRKAYAANRHIGRGEGAGISIEPLLAILK